MNAEFFRLMRGERVLKSVIEWENPVGMDNVNKMVQSKDVVGQITFDAQGKFDTIYFMPSKIKV